jgi:hypothetical protein
VSAQPAEAILNLSPRCGCCGSALKGAAPSAASQDIATEQTRLCVACENVLLSGLNPRDHPELTRRLLEGGIVLQRLPAGFFRILPRPGI